MLKTLVMGEAEEKAGQGSCSMSRRVPLLPCTDRVPLLSAELVSMFFQKLQELGNRATCEALLLLQSYS